MFEIELVDFFPVKVNFYPDLIYDLEMRLQYLSKFLISDLLATLFTAESSKC
jgi:hypothetical protein